MSYFKKVSFFILSVLLIGFPVHAMEKDAHELCFLREIPPELLIEVVSKSKSSIDLFKLVALLRLLDKKFKILIDTKFPEFTQFLGKQCNDDEQFEMYAEKLFDWLYKIKGSIDTRGKFGRTLLHAAVLNNNLPAAKVLLALQSNLSMLDSLGYAAYQLALRNENQPIINLFEQKLSVDDRAFLKSQDFEFSALRPNSDFETALNNEDCEIIKKKLFQKGKSFLDWLIRTVYDKQRFQEIYNKAETDECLCRFLNSDCLETCLNYANADAFLFLHEHSNSKYKHHVERKKRWLFKASGFGLQEVFDYFNYIESQDELDYGSTLFLKACLEGQLPIVNYMINNRCKRGKLSGLHNACSNGHLHVVKYLIGHGADINDNAVEASWTPLITACAYGFLNIVTFLVEQGADSTMLDINNKTALDYAKEQKHKKIVEFLEQHELTKEMESIQLEKKSKESYGE